MHPPPGGFCLSSLCFPSSQHVSLSQGTVSVLWGHNPFYRCFMPLFSFLYTGFFLKSSEAKGLGWMSILTPPTCRMMPCKVNPKTETCIPGTERVTQTDFLLTVKVLCFQGVRTKQMFLCAGPILSESYWSTRGEQRLRASTPDSFQPRREAVESPQHKSELLLLPFVRL